MTDAEYQAWLGDQSAVPCVLVDAVALVGGSPGTGAGGVETNLYFSDKGYNTSPTDTPANRHYSPDLIKDVTFVESLSLDSTNASMTIGDLHLDNTDRSKDDYVDYVWSNREITLFYGDMSWPRADFVTIFTGVVETIECNTRNEIILKIRDKLQRLNGSLTSATTSLSFGEVFNVSPTLIDAALHEYQVHDGPIEDIIEVRDLGVPVSITKELAAGKFKLLAQPAGTITATVQGDKNTVYNTTIANMIKHIVKNYGVNEFTDDDIDLTNFSDYEEAFGHDKQVGFYSNKKENLLSVINGIADSLGSQVVCNRQGKLQIHQIVWPLFYETIDIYQKDIYENSLKISKLLDVYPVIKAGYKKNYTVQEYLNTGISTQLKELFRQEWLVTGFGNASHADFYKLNRDVDKKETYLIVSNDAAAECVRLVHLRGRQRKIYSFEGLPKLLTLELGQAITLYNDAYNLEYGEKGTLIKIESNWTKRTVKCDVFI